MRRTSLGRIVGACIVLFILIRSAHVGCLKSILEILLLFFVYGTLSFVANLAIKFLGGVYEVDMRILLGVTLIPYEEQS